ncbi:hypothetical protein ACFCP7_10615 [Paenibacillus elgii]
MSVYIACNDLDFDWRESEVASFEQAWNDGLSIKEIAKAFNRDPDEVAILAMDRCRCGAISERPGGAWGRRMRA